MQMKGLIIMEREVKFCLKQTCKHNVGGQNGGRIPSVLTLYLKLLNVHKIFRHMYRLLDLLYRNTYIKITTLHTVQYISNSIVPHCFIASFNLYFIF